MKKYSKFMLAHGKITALVSHQSNISGPIVTLKNCGIPTLC